MTTLRTTDDHLEVRFTAAEKLAGLLRDVRVPLSAVRGVEVVADGLSAARGVRAPGLGLPGLRKIGTWRTRSGKDVVAVRRGQDAVRVHLAGQRWASLLIGTDDAAAVAASVTAAVSAASARASS